MLNQYFDLHYLISEKNNYRKISTQILISIYNFFFSDNAVYSDIDFETTKR